jgi:hypothetical protein
MLDRIMGVIRLHAPTYRQIADDTTATGQAAIIVVISLLIQGFFQGLVRLDPNGTVAANPGGAVVTAVLTLIFGLIAWVVSAWVLAFVAKWFGGRTDMSEMLRVTGYVEVFGIIGVLTAAALVSPILGCLAGIIALVVAILRLIGYLIGVREAAEFSTGNAIVTAIIAALVNFLIVAVIGGTIGVAVLTAMGISGALGR